MQILEEIKTRLGTSSPLKIGLIALAMAAIYFLPTLIALLRRHPSSLKIASANLLGGWTWASWIALAVWAFRPQRAEAKTEAPTGRTGR